MTWESLEGGIDSFRIIKAKITKISQQLLRKSQPFDHNYSAETNIYEVVVQVSSTQGQKGKDRNFIHPLELRLREIESVSCCTDRLRTTEGGVLMTTDQIHGLVKQAESWSWRRP